MSLPLENYTVPDALDGTDSSDDDQPIARKQLKAPSFVNEDTVEPIIKPFTEPGAHSLSGASADSNDEPIIRTKPKARSFVKEET
jgi:hypothetical protein